MNNINNWNEELTIGTAISNIIDLEKRYFILQDRINKTIDKLSFIDEALENDTLNVPLCIAKINKALEILGDNNEC